VTATAQVLEERYGRRRQRGLDRRVAWSLGGALVLAALVFFIAVFWQGGNSVESKVVHYTVVDAQSVTLDYEVTSEPGASVVCALEGLSPSFATVAWKIVELPESEQRTRRFTETLRTTSEATTATIRGCWEATAPA